ncbi:unnamed protein product [Alopecurus aequalis]
METRKAKAAAARKGARSSGDRDEAAGDLISGLPDAILGTIISFLPTKDGGSTQALSRRWRHLWRSAPLNLQVHPRPADFLLPAVPPSAVSKIISRHLGPGRRFSFTCLRAGDLYAKAESCFRSRALANLQELDIGYEYDWAPTEKSSYPLPLLALGSASTLLILRVSNCDFPDEIAPSMSFPLLKRLSLHGVSIPGHVFHGLLSGCHALESLYITDVRCAGGLRVSSPTLRSIGLEVDECFRGSYLGRAELVIQDAPCLERLLLPGYHTDAHDCVTIRVIGAPKLEILGPFSACSSKLQVFKGMSPACSVNSICTVKILALECTDNQLNAVLDVLRWLPCLEKLYVSFLEHYNMYKQSKHQYDPLHPIECLETHLKEVVLKYYSGNKQKVDFARFFVLNAQVLNKIEFQVCGGYSSGRVDNQHKLLQVENRASRDAQFEFKNTCFYMDYRLSNQIHDLSEGDPFRKL